MYFNNLMGLLQHKASCFGDKSIILVFTEELRPLSNRSDSITDWDDTAHY